jgi:hypothetical protein
MSFGRGTLAENETLPRTQSRSLPRREARYRLAANPLGSSEQGHVRRDRGASDRACRGGLDLGIAGDDLFALFLDGKFQPDNGVVVEIWL